MKDVNNNIYAYGKLFKDKAQEEVEGFSIYDCEDMFNGGELKQLSMKYEVFGALVKH
eukprot:CAMPEP_0176396192 /NCGR_PEP_ID=MMETSP0126-20121128/44032_1 /TAXON_ID=141414 ORGANISM="Strombidinopsis acuminatum, Strain SPMC142" /NCGR_SAMPLE_ID=MMETSP0126 /ASSEMBLY_ACC=CAM_ASM_000229 /LENGTH=56 /DNA_ID=CAMNT_0017769563 /DNA_START=1132 /DNA_END=1302 /DNA_ORIENTATION=+